jgi:hypothetical protein
VQIACRCPRYYADFKHADNVRYGLLRLEQVEPLTNTAVPKKLQSQLKSAFPAVCGGEYVVSHKIHPDNYKSADESRAVCAVGASSIIVLSPPRKDGEYAFHSHDPVFIVQKDNMIPCSSFRKHGRKFEEAL